MLGAFSAAACLDKRRPLIHRGDIWDADIPGAGIHPVIGREYRATSKAADSTVAGSQPVATVCATIAG
jgi:hypothetical protein